MEALAFITSLVALIVSAVALYLASLRPAAISVSAVEGMSWPEVDGSWEGAIPPTKFAIAVYRWNTGAQGGVLQGIGAFDLKPAGPWGVIEPGDLTKHQRSGPITLPAALEAGALETAYLQAKLHYHEVSEDPEAFARSLRGLASITFDISWSYLRTTRLRRKQKPKTETLSVTVDCSSWKRDVLYTWATKPDQGHLVELAGMPLDVAKRG
jgi:hypothetical protein